MQELAGYPTELDKLQNLMDDYCSELVDMTVTSQDAMMITDKVKMNMRRGGAASWRNTGHRRTSSTSRSIGKVHTEETSEAPLARASQAGSWLRGTQRRTWSCSWRP